MARKHITYPDSLDAELAALMNRYSLKPLAVYARAIELVIADLRRRFAEAANDPVIALPSGERAAVSPAVADALASAGIPPARPYPDSILRGDTRWFEVIGVANELDIGAEDLMRDLDPDDVLDYAGKQWIDSAGLAVAFSFTSAEQAQAFQSWAATL